MRPLLLLTTLCLAGCGGRGVTPPQQPPAITPAVPQIILDHHPAAKAYVAPDGRTFYWSGPGDPTILPAAWDQGKVEILAVRPGAVLADPLPGLVFAFQPCDVTLAVGRPGYYSAGCKFGAARTGLANLREQLREIGAYCDERDCYMGGDTCFPFQGCPIMTIFVRSFDSAPVVTFEARHALWGYTWPLEQCASDPTTFVWTRVGEGGACDPFEGKQR